MSDKKAELSINGMIIIGVVLLVLAIIALVVFDKYDKNDCMQDCLDIQSKNYNHTESFSVFDYFTCEQLNFLLSSENSDYVNNLKSIEYYDTVNGVCIYENDEYFLEIQNLNNNHKYYNYFNKIDYINFYLDNCFGDDD